MSELYSKLSGDWLMRGWSNHPWTLVNRFTTNFFNLNDDLRYVIESCDGKSDLHSTAFLPRHRALIQKLLKLGVIVECEYGDGLPEVQKYRYTDNPLILEVHWAITGRCNMNCRHCFMESPQGKYGELDWPHLEKLVDQFVRANVIRVSLTGGEPLLHRDFRSLLRLLTDKGIFINQIATNGTLLDEDIFLFLQELGQKPDFQISFDGCGEHDRMRDTIGQEPRVINAIRQSIAHGHTTAICTIFSRENIHAAQKTYELMRELGVGLWMISRAQTAGNWQGGENALTTEEMGELCLELQRKWLSDGRLFPISLEQFYNGHSGMSEYQRVDPEGYMLDSLECPTTRWKAFLLPNGTVLPCTGYTGSFLEKDMPNLLDTELRLVWTQSTHAEFTTMTKRARMEGIAECRACEYLSKCGTGCRSYALTETGTMMKGDPFTCALYKGGWKQRFLDAEISFDRGKVYEKA